MNQENFLFFQQMNKMYFFFFSVEEHAEYPNCFKFDQNSLN